MPVRSRSVLRHVILVALLSVLFAAVAAPAAQASTKEVPNGGKHCKLVDIKDLNVDLNTKVFITDKHGNVLAVGAVIVVGLEAKLRVCVFAKADAAVFIVAVVTLGDAIKKDHNGDGKFDEIVVPIKIVAKANAKVRVEATIKVKVGLVVKVSAFAKAEFDLKKDEEKECKAGAKK